MNTLSQIEQRRSQLLTAYHERKGALDSLERQEKELILEVEKLSGDVSSLNKAIFLLQSYSEDQQKILAERIEGVVTAGIRAVFQDPNLVFRMKYSETKKGAVKKTPEVTMSVMYQHNGKEVEGSLRNSFGGGLMVVASTLLNVIVTLQLVPRVRPILIWDEPLRDLSPPYEDQDPVAKGYRERMADFLRTLVSETELQIIMVTHEPDYGRVADFHHRFSGGIGKEAKIKTMELGE